MEWVGSTVEREVTFRDMSGALADPTTVTASSKDPLGTVAPATLVANTSVGRYDILFAVDLAGLWYYRVVGAGDEGDVVIEGSFCVLPSSVESLTS